MELVDTSENQWSIQEFPSTDTPLFMQCYLKNLDAFDRFMRHAASVLPYVPPAVLGSN